MALISEANARNPTVTPNEIRPCTAVYDDAERDHVGPERHSESPYAKLLLPFGVLSRRSVGSGIVRLTHRLLVVGNPEGRKRRESQ